jgi:hypothetical protein
MRLLALEKRNNGGRTDKTQKPYNYDSPHLSPDNSQAELYLYKSYQTASKLDKKSKNILSPKILN